MRAKSSLYVQCHSPMKEVCHLPPCVSDVLFFTHPLQSLLFLDDFAAHSIHPSLFLDVLRLLCHVQLMRAIAVVLLLAIGALADPARPNLHETFESHRFVVFVICESATAQLLFE